MAVIKCKMCGGDLNITEGMTVCECEYCGTKQTVPSADNEKKLTLFGRAGRLLRACEFDKASGVFETIIADFPEEAEAYWGLVLCKYGIEYVDDPATGKKIPTCHRSSFESVLDDVNYEQACENTDAIARRVYREEARQLEELRKSIIEVSGREEPYDVFISYKETDENGDRTLDSVIAQDIYTELTEKGYRVFFSRISLEDKLGVEYEPYIFAALNSAKVMLVVGTDYEHFDAVWVKNEWSRFLKLIASGQKKTLIPVFKNMDPYDMPKEFAKLSAQDMGKVGAMQDLLRGVNKLIGKNSDQMSTAAQADTGMTALNAQTSSMLKRGYMMLNDEDYEKADEFFEKVLNNDAECGQAYWGKALAQEEVRSAEEFGTIFLFSRLEEPTDTDIKTIVLPTESLSSLARKADKNSILKDFTDQELAEMLTDLDNTPVQYQTALSFYQMKEKQYSEPAALHKLAASSDFDRASKYADDTVHEAERTALNSFRARLTTVIEEERKKEAKAKQDAENNKEWIVATIKSWLSEVTEVYQSQLIAIEEERKEAEEKAEKEYQTALARFERDYNIGVANQEKAYETDVALWEQKKADFEKNYNTAIEKAEQLRTNIRQLEREKSNLNGFFTGRKRKELEDNIALLNKKLDGIAIPEDPGDKPEKPPVLIKGRAPQREDFKPVMVSSRAADMREQIRCSLSLKVKREEIKKLKTKNPGDEIRFGSYFAQNGKQELIVWEVLAKENNRLLVISKLALDCQQYHSSRTDITWEKCDLRKWLNDTFLNTAFNAEEQTMIPTVTVNADKNLKCNTNPGNSTQDKVFLLSIPEVRKYFSADEARKCGATEYAKSKGCKDDLGFTWWWLRSPGINSCNAAGVRSDGSVYDLGASVRFSSFSVRPALWINIAS